MCHVSRVTCHVSTENSGVSQWPVCYQGGQPRLGSLAYSSYWSITYEYAAKPLDKRMNEGM